MRTKIILLFAVLIVLIAIPSFAEDFAGKLVKVTDGDTVQVMHDGKAEKIRLEGIDCPEKTQPFSNNAKQFVLNAGAGKTVARVAMAALSARSSGIGRSQRSG